VARWIDDIVAGDDHGHHLVLAARGHTDGKVHGQRLCLYAAGATRGLIGEWLLSPAIAVTATTHDHYRQIVQQVIERHGIGRVIVSSLIGHSLDALRTGLPTLQVLHDYYPAWPVLDHDPLEFDNGDGIDLAGALAASGNKLLFECTDAAFWQELARQWLKSTTEHPVHLIAPTGQVRQRWCRLMGDELECIDIVPHGFEGWTDAPDIQPAPRADGRLNLVVVGRLSPGKGLGLLEKALPELREIAHVTLVGCGHHGMRLFGQAGVDILLDFRREQLPGILATLRPQAALFLSTVAETWNYVLSETRSLGLVPVATRTGSFVERIDDGHDGLLFDPSPEALLHCLSGLHEDPAPLEQMAARLPAETNVEASIAQWNGQVTAVNRRLPEPVLANADRIQTDALEAALADGHETIRRLEQQNDALYLDLVERTDWARKQERLNRERTRDLRKVMEQARQQAEEFEERIRWALSLDEALQQERARADHLQAYVQAVHTSTSWRLTRPLRFLVRVAGNARTHRAWNPLRWPRLLGQFSHNLRVGGLRGAIERMQHLDTPGPVDAPIAPVATTAFTEPPANPDPANLPGSAHPSASIIIPVYNKYEYTAACLHSIAEHTPAGDWEVIVVDDCSSDQTPDYLSACRGIRVIRNAENSGFIRSCNAGAEAARGDYLVFLNNDTTVTAGWLDALIGTFDQIEDAGIVGARLVYPDGRLQEAGGIIFNDASGWNYGRGDDAALPQYNFVSEADYVSGACLAIGKAGF
jgi:O-antigen biosynthesis protein